MDSYYANFLSAERLKRCYEIASPRVKRYLEAEIDYVLERIRPEDAVLELGCGYGRVLQRLLEKGRWIIGIDNSFSSLRMARQTLGRFPSCSLAEMDAGNLGFLGNKFDVVLCIQNGVSSFKVDPMILFREAIRVTRKGGKVLFSSYSSKFWETRLGWFRIQAAEGLIGEIDEEKTGSGVIFCRDGFRATTFSTKDFESAAADLGLAAYIEEVDDSSLICEFNP